MAIRGMVLLWGVTGWLAACSSGPNAPWFTKGSVFHAWGVPDGSLRVGEVKEVATRQEIIGTEFAQVLASVGISDAQIHDGCVIAARVNCCDNPDPGNDYIAAYVPAPLQVGVGDVVEIWSGTFASGASKMGSKPNTVTAVRSQASTQSRQCRWEPDRPGLWAKKLHCDWMSDEGWIQQEGLHNYWIKPIAAPSPPLPPAK